MTTDKHGDLDIHIDYSDNILVALDKLNEIIDYFRDKYEYDTPELVAAILYNDKKQALNENTKEYLRVIIDSDLDWPIFEDMKRAEEKRGKK